MSIPWVAHSDRQSNNSECESGYKANVEGFIYKELIETLIEENLVEIEDIKNILKYKYNEYKTTSKSAYKKTYEKGYEKIIKEIYRKSEF